MTDNGALEEAVPECVKNILLVLGSAGYLAPLTHAPGQSREEEEVSGDEGEREKKVLRRRLWDVTAPRLERFLPGLLGEVFPPPAASPAPASLKTQGGVSGSQETAAPSAPSTQAEGLRPA